MPTELRFDFETGEVQELPYEPAASPIPSEVTRRQAKHALLNASVLHQIDQSIAGLPTPDRERALIDWQEAAVFRRDSSLVTSLGQALGLDDAAIDALFIAAAEVPD